MAILSRKYWFVGDAKGYETDKLIFPMAGSCERLSRHCDTIETCRQLLKKYLEDNPRGTFGLAIYRVDITRET